MIVIAIIGILAAALFPSLTAYLARGRDTSRSTGMREISTAVASLTLDKAWIVISWVWAGNACTDSGALNSYLPKFPIDPIKTRQHGTCTTPGVYGYATGTINSVEVAIISAHMENANGGNTGSITAYQGYVSSVAPIDSFIKWTGSGYVIRN